MSAGFHEKFFDAGNSGASITLNMDNGSYQRVTLTANATVAFSNPPTVGRAYGFTLQVVQDATGSRIPTWPASVKWPGGTAPLLSTAAAKTDLITFNTVDGGANWFALLAGKGF